MFPLDSSLIKLGLADFGQITKSRGKLLVESLTKIVILLQKKAFRITPQKYVKKFHNLGQTLKILKVLS